MHISSSHLAAMEGVSAAIVLTDFRKLPSSLPAPRRLITYLSLKTRGLLRRIVVSRRDAESVVTVLRIVFYEPTAIGFWRTIDGSRRFRGTRCECACLDSL